MFTPLLFSVLFPSHLHLSLFYFISSPLLFSTLLFAPLPSSPPFLSFPSFPLVVTLLLSSSLVSSSLVSSPLVHLLFSVSPAHEFQCAAAGGGEQDREASDWLKVGQAGPLM